MSPGERRRFCSRGSCCGVEGVDVRQYGLVQHSGGSDVRGAEVLPKPAARTVEATGAISL